MPIDKGIFVGHLPAASGSAFLLSEITTAAIFNIQGWFSQKYLHIVQATKSCQKSIAHWGTHEHRQHNQSADQPEC